MHGFSLHVLPPTLLEGTLHREHLRRQNNTDTALLCSALVFSYAHLLPPLISSLFSSVGEKVAKLAELVTAWAVSRRCVLGREHSFNGVTRYHQLRKSSMDTEPQVDHQSGPGTFSPWCEFCARVLSAGPPHLPPTVFIVGLVRATANTMSPRYRMHDHFQTLNPNIFPVISARLTPIRVQRLRQSACNEYCENPIPILCQVPCVTLLNPFLPLQQ